MSPYPPSEQGCVPSDNLGRSMSPYVPSEHGRVPFFPQGRSIFPHKLSEQGSDQTTGLGHVPFIFQGTQSPFSSFCSLSYLHPRLSGNGRGLSKPAHSPLTCGPHLVFPSPQAGMLWVVRGLSSMTLDPLDPALS